MLVLSRQRGMSTCVWSAEESSVVTVLAFYKSGRVGLLVNYASVSKPGRIESRNITLERDARFQVSKGIAVVLLDVRADKVRLGIETADENYAVRRLEVIQDMKLGPESEDDDEPGLSGSPVPRSPFPAPPTLNTQLDEPPSLDDDES